MDSCDDAVDNCWYQCQRLANDARLSVKHRHFVEAAAELLWRVSSERASEWLADKPDGVDQEQFPVTP